jgi:hypothetical protein
VPPIGLCSTTTGPPVCASSCVAPSPNLCGSQCVDVKSDPKNCGTCGHNCGALPNVKAGASVQCVQGGCSIPAASCSTGYGHCSTVADDGCETNLTLPATCGKCTNLCVPPTGLCSTGGGSPMCSSSCTNPTPDLCPSKCVNKMTDPANCGGCGRDCGALPHLKPGAVTQCSSGSCVVPQSACAAGFANCSTGNNDADGCETPTNTNSNCGSCGNACAANQTCSGGGCVAQCKAGDACTQGLGPCRRGTTTCASSTSQPSCVDAGADDSRGGCSNGLVCKGGACAAPCQAGIACTQGIGPCRKGTTSCASPASDPTCNDSGIDDSQQCSGGFCQGGQCVLCGNDMQPCCGGPLFSIGGTMCNSNQLVCHEGGGGQGVCHSCGALNAYCCAGGVCNEGTCQPAVGTSGPFCGVSCGQKEFDPCCPDRSCSGGLQCAFSPVVAICKMCGTYQNPCCPNRKCDGELPDRALFCKDQDGSNSFCDISP